MAKLRDYRAQLSPQLAVLLGGASKGVVARVISIALLFIFNLYVARTLGDAGSGLFFLGISVVTSFAVLARFGLEGPVLRASARLVSDKDWAALRADYAGVMAFCVGSGALLSLAVYGFSDVLAVSVFDKPEFEAPLRYMAFAILPLSLLIIHARYLRAIEHIGMSLLAQSALIPGVFLLLAVVPLGVSQVGGLAIMYSVAAALSLTFIVIYFLRSIPLLGQQPSRGNFSKYASDGRGLFLPSIMDQIIQPLSAVLILGYWGTAAEIGLFSVASRVAALVAFAVIPVVAIYSPRVAVLSKADDREGMRMYTHAATKVILLIALPMLACITFGSEWLMSWFGPDFRAGSHLLVILALGQGINALTGPSRALLLMSGKDGVYRRASIIGGLLGLVSSLVFVPLWGAVGAALGASIGIASVNLLSAYFVWAGFGILPLQMPGSSDESARSSVGKGE